MNNKATYILRVNRPGNLPQKLERISVHAGIDAYTYRVELNPEQAKAIRSDTRIVSICQDIRRG